MRPARGTFVALALATIAVGLAVHRLGPPLDATLGRAPRDVLGDALWAAMMTWWMGVIAPTAPRHLRAAAALAVCFAVEASQLYSAPSLDALRATTAGRLVLGSGFDPRDLAAYAAGVAAAYLLDGALPTRGRRHAPDDTTDRPA